MSDSKKSMPPRDSWIVLAPGASVHVDERLGREWKKQKRDCREIRGNVLASCFEIEYVLDQIICEAMLPQPQSTAVSRDLLDELFLKGAGATFRSKIDVLRKLRLRLPSLQALLSEDIVAKLNSVREVRNDFAHYPVTFEPVGTAPDQTLLSVLATRRGRVVLNEAFLKDTGELFGAVMSALEAAHKALLPSEKAGQQDGA